MHAVNKFFDEVSTRSLTQLENLRDECFLRYLIFEMACAKKRFAPVKTASNAIALLVKNMIQAENEAAIAAAAMKKAEEDAAVAAKRVEEFSSGLRLGYRQPSSNIDDILKF